MHEPEVNPRKHMRKELCVIGSIIFQKRVIVLAGKEVMETVVHLGALKICSLQVIIISKLCILTLW